MEQIVFVDLIQVLVQLHGHNIKIGAQQFLPLHHCLIWAAQFIQALMIGQIHREKAFIAFIQTVENIVL
jgi:hypothetical protein